MNSTSLDIPNRASLTAREVAYVFHVSVKTVYNWYNEGRLEGYKTPGRAIRFRRDVVIEIMSNSE